MKRFYFLLALIISFLSVEAKKVTVYFNNIDNWEEVWIYSWRNGDTPFGQWPGSQIKSTTTVNGTTVFTAQPDDAYQIIFSNGKIIHENGNIQTMDLPVKEGYIYNPNTTPQEVDNMIPPIMPTGTLPILYIVCDDPEIISKDLADKEYRAAKYWLDAKGINGWKNVGSEDAMLDTQIKARGNYTRTAFSKKPFKLKLDKKQNLLDLTPEKNKHYALLAHADDTQGYLRNFIGFNLGRRMNEQLPWTPGMQPIEVVINGDYRGLYFLTESIRVAKDRIDIVELEDNVDDPAKVSGGYIVEFDNYESDGQIVFSDPAGFDALRITPDTPEVYSALQYKFVSEQFETMNNLVHQHSDELWKYLDLDAAAAYYVVEEIIDHRESYHGSTYLFRDYGKGKKWIFSPLWDCGNAFTRENPDSYFTDSTLFGNNWINDLRKNDKFMKKVKEIWKWFWGTQVEGLYNDIENFHATISEAAVRDHSRWGNAPHPQSGNSQGVANNSNLKSKWDFVRHALEVKINWLSEKWGNPDSNASVPEKDDTEAAPLPSYVIDSMESVEISSDENKRVEYYDVYGRRVIEPVKGNIYIRRGTMKSEVIIK